MENNDRQTVKINGSTGQLIITSSKGIIEGDKQYVQIEGEYVIDAKTLQILKHIIEEKSQFSCRTPIFTMPHFKELSIIDHIDKIKNIDDLIKELENSYKLIVELKNENKCLADTISKRWYNRLLK
jgi:hypothetical protein